MDKKYSTDIDNKIDLEIAEVSINQGILDKNNLIKINQIFTSC